MQRLQIRYILATVIMELRAPMLPTHNVGVNDAFVFASNSDSQEENTSRCIIFAFHANQF